MPDRNVRPRRATTRCVGCGISSLKAETRTPRPALFELACLKCRIRLPRCRFGLCAVPSQLLIQKSLAADSWACPTRCRSDSVRFELEEPSWRSHCAPITMLPASGLKARESKNVGQTRGLLVARMAPAQRIEVPGPSRASLLSSDTQLAPHATEQSWRDNPGCRCALPRCDAAPARSSMRSPQPAGDLSVDYGANGISKISQQMPAIGHLDCVEGTLAEDVCGQRAGEPTGGKCQFILQWAGRACRLKSTSPWNH